MPTVRAASSKVWLPRTLVRKKRPGSSTARLLCDSAAKFTITSISRSRSSCSARSKSPMSPCTNVMRLSTSSRLGRLPAYVSRSSTTTRSSGCCSTQYRVKLEPMKPAPPVTSRFMTALCSQTHVGTPLGFDVAPHRVRLVPLRQDGVDDAPVGADLGIVPRHPELVGRVVVGVHEVRDRHVGQRREPVRDTRRDEHAAVIVSAVGVPAELECERGAIGR